MSIEQQILTSAVTAAIVGPAVALLGQRWQQTREDHSRFLTLRREAYIGLLSAASTAHRVGGLLLHVTAGDLAKRALQPHYAQLDAAGEAAAEHYDTIRLLAPRAVVRASMRTTGAVMLLRVATLGIGDVPFTDDDLKRLQDAGRALEHLARRDLHVDSRFSRPWTAPTVRERLRRRRRRS